MTDKELLELAAKAAGYEVFGNKHPEDGLNILVDGKGYLWRPRHDDGDALRLAVRLGLLFRYMHDRFEMFQSFYCQELDKDFKPSEATRSAITRAAAEIGRAMP